jgi:putative transposase
LVSNYKTIVIENLNVLGMLKNRKLSKSIMDAGFGMFKVMMEYKCKLYNNKLIYADTFYPSSKTCSNCGEIKKDLKLSDRIYKCDSCGFEIDRDINASINLKKLATGYSDSINDDGV